VECSALRALRATPDEGVRGYTCAGRLGVFGIQDGEPRSCTSCSFEHFGWVSLYANVVLCPCREIYVRCWWSFAWWIFATKSGFFEAGWYRIPPSPPAKVWYYRSVYLLRTARFRPDGNACDTPRKALSNSPPYLNLTDSGTACDEPLDCTSIRRPGTASRPAASPSVSELRTQLGRAADA